MCKTLRSESKISESFVENLISEFWLNENKKASVYETAHAILLWWAIVVLVKRFNERKEHSVIFSKKNQSHGIRSLSTRIIMISKKWVWLFVMCTSACDPNRSIEYFVMSAFQCYCHSIIYASLRIANGIHSQNVLFYWIWSLFTLDSASWNGWSSIKSNPWIKLMCILAFWFQFIFNSWYHEHILCSRFLMAFGNVSIDDILLMLVFDINNELLYSS